MVAGGYDRTTGRRTMFNRCVYWKQDTEIKDKSRLVLERKPFGTFKCKKATAQDLSPEIIDDVFRFMKNSVTLMTFDYVNIAPDDIVKFDNKVWRVTNTQFIEDERQDQFKVNISGKTFIRLVR